MLLCGGRKVRGGWREGRGRLNKVAADPKGAPVAPAVTVVNGPGISLGAAVTCESSVRACVRGAAARSPLLALMAAAPTTALQPFRSNTAPQTHIRDCVSP